MPPLWPPGSWRLPVSQSPDGSAADLPGFAAVFREMPAGATDADRGRLLREAVAGGLSVAAGMIGCSITEIDGSRYRTPWSSGTAARAIDELQYRAGTGPCLSAARDQGQHLVDLKEGPGRSRPEWAPDAARYGVGSVLSIPLTGTEYPASINFYASSMASFRAADAIARAALLGRAAARLMGPGSAARSTFEPADYSGARAGRELLARARAAVAAQEGITDSEAFSWLARRSAREDRSIFATARALLDAPGWRSGNDA